MAGTPADAACIKAAPRVAGSGSRCSLEQLWACKAPPAAGKACSEPAEPRKHCSVLPYPVVPLGGDCGCCRDLVGATAAAVLCSSGCLAAILYCRRKAVYL